MKTILLALSFLTVLGCSTPHCKRAPEENKAQNVVAPEQVEGTVSAVAPSPSGKVFVYKYDGSQQCGMGKKIPLATMEKQLKGIKIYSKANKPDGLMHIQVCGSTTGFANVFEIDAKDLSEALKLGFKKWEYK